MKRLMTLAIVALAPLIASAQYGYQTVAGCAPSQDVTDLCQRALQTFQVQTTSTTYTIPPPPPVTATTTTVYSTSSAADLSYLTAPRLYSTYNYTSANLFRTIQPHTLYVPGRSQFFTPGAYGTGATVFPAGTQININNGLTRGRNVTGGFVNAGLPLPGTQININNNVQARRGQGGGGLIAGLGGAVSGIIDSVGRVANSPAGLVAIGAGIGGAGPLGGLLGGGKGNGGGSLTNFFAAKGAGANNGAAAAFAASQRGRGR